MKPAVARGFTREGRRIVFNRGRDLIAVVPFFPPFFEKDSSFSSFLSRLEIGWELKLMWSIKVKKKKDIRGVNGEYFFIIWLITCSSFRTLIMQKQNEARINIHHDSPLSKYFISTGKVDRFVKFHAKCIRLLSSSRRISDNIFQRRGSPVRKIKIRLQRDPAWKTSENHLLLPLRYITSSSQRRSEMTRTKSSPYITEWKQHRQRGRTLHRPSASSLKRGTKELKNIKQRGSLKSHCVHG